MPTGGGGGRRRLRRGGRGEGSRDADNGESYRKHALLPGFVDPRTLAEILKLATETRTMLRAKHVNGKFLDSSGTSAWEDVVRVGRSPTGL
jgi:hypothetical protein